MSTSEIKDKIHEMIDGLDDSFLRVVIHSSIPLMKYLRKHLKIGLTRRFPYAIHYLIEPDKVIVLAVLHTKRKPRV